MNFLMLYGNSPDTAVGSYTIIDDIRKVLFENINVATLSLILPQALESITGQDAKFEVVRSNTLTPIPLRLIYQKNIVTQS